MEKLRNINFEPKTILRENRVRIATSVFVASTALFATAQVEGRIPYVPLPIPRDEFHPVILNKAQAKERDLIVNIPPRVPQVFEKPTFEPTTPPDWKLDPEISWYGPNFYGKRTACGLELTKDLLGVAHRDLPCGTLVAFKWEDKQITVPVVDRGPYVDGRIFDLTGGACVALDHCFTGPINYRIEK